MIIPHLYADKIEKIEGKIGDNGEETISELVSLNEKWM